jgi:hypothetical protein
VGEVIDLATLRRKAAASQKGNDADFLAFCEAVGGLAGLQQRNRDARSYAQALEADDAIKAALAFLHGALT